MTILPDFHSNVVIFCAFRRPKRGCEDLAGLRSNFIPIFAVRRAKRGGADLARFSLKFGDFSCVSQTQARL
jgi:hypothetical protein